MEEIFSPGNVIRIRDFTFEDGSTRDKYLIVLCRTEAETFVIFTLTTSRNKLDVPGLHHGCSVHNNIPFFFFPANLPLDAEGFYFDAGTFLFFKDNIRKNAIRDFQKYFTDVLAVLRLATLPNEELKRLLKCILKSRFVPMGLKGELEGFKNSLG